MEKIRFGAVLVAGPTPIEIKENTNIPNSYDKNLILLNGKPMFIYAAEALNKARSISKLCVVGSKELLPYISKYLDGVIFIKSQKTFVNNLIRGCKRLNEEKPPLDKIVISTSDIPLIRPEHIDDLVDSCYKVRDFRDSSVVLPIYKKNSGNKEIESMKPHYLIKITGERFRHANLCIADQSFIKELITSHYLYNMTEDLFSKKKMGLLPYIKFGRGKILKYIFKNKKLTIQELEDTVSINLSNYLTQKNPANKLCIILHTVITHYPQFVVDVDYDTDFGKVNKYFQNYQ
ncbi:MAG: NTP transferase domain-containing protein [Nanoarchaeota archaeon]|nr:NTP transferase domain-containing protein [Nanoarchaeota archaeon]MBU4284135.1 NTP transferase domain-containing protein [Nanoarchaeota archaeon]MBU4493474.1 NTP transferase domain-containing protein [Nanoarchaeota archaeon]